MESFLTCLCLPLEKQVALWSGISLFSLHTAIGPLDLFVALDRLLALTCPLKYRVIKTKLLVASLTICTSLYISMFLVYSLYRRPKPPAIIKTIDFVNSQLMEADYVWNMVMIMMNILISVAFAVKLKRFLSSGATIKRTKLVFVNVLLDIPYMAQAHTIVLYQIVLECIFWMAPSLTKVIMEYGFHKKVIVIKAGPVTLTAFMVYVATCSVMYWRKLSRAQKETPNNTLFQQRERSNKIGI
uniref:G_PROTEIN_RECEP_F1_2 domain-containing protein n=1 Tax=Steinernema glaseri TaxID=37863 RepID=A0A1I7YJ84_9BILA